MLSWRIEQLIAVGYDSDAAFVLGLDRSIDLHDATELAEARVPAADGLPHSRLTACGRYLRSPPEAIPSPLNDARGEGGACDTRPSPSSDDVAMTSSRNRTP